MRALYFLASLFALAAGQSCSPGFVRFGNSCYYFVTSRVNWFDADQYCASLIPNSYAVHLVSIESNLEETFIRQQIAADSVISDRDIWISATQIDKNRGWTWAATQQSLSYTNWGSGRPGSSGKCGFLSWWYDYRWDNDDCTDRKSFICEYSLNGQIDHANNFDNLAEGVACPPGFFSFDKSCYYFIPSSLNWFDADQYCTLLVPASYDVHLVAINTNAEQVFIQNTVSSAGLYRGRQYWTSGSIMDRPAGWQWERTQNRLSFTNWASDEPNGSGDCIQLWADRFYAWDDADCEDEPSSHGFICEVES